MANFSTFTHQYPKESKELVFIDVSASPSTTTKQTPAPPVKEERPATPEEKPAKETPTKPKSERVSLQCSECSRMCYSAEHMVRHLRVHRGENPFQCIMCEYSTYNKTLFEEHVNTHMGIKPYQCSHCDYRSVSKKYIKKHESRHTACLSCGFIAKNLRKLKQHREQNGCHAPPPEDEFQAEFKCENCAVSYTSKGALQTHIKNHKQCPYCDESCEKLSFCPKMLREHLVEKHAKEAIAQKKYKFNCAKCEFKANGHSKILLHLIHHPQSVSETIDITPLIRTGILTG